jgi:hypothetical protein
MLDALRTSTEPREHIELARAYLRGVVGDLVQRKKAAKDKTLLANAESVYPVLRLQKLPNSLPTSTPAATSTYSHSPYTSFTPTVPYRNTFEQDSHHEDSGREVS